MEYILDRNGNIIHRSKSMRGIRRYVSNHLIKWVDISCISNRSYEGLLSILFENGDSYQRVWSNYSALKDMVRYWRNIHGAKLTVNGDDYGKIGYDNYRLRVTEIINNRIY